MSDLLNELKSQLCSLREQGMKISDINPISALADMISDKLCSEQLSMGDIEGLLDHIAAQTWHEQADKLASQTDLANYDESAIDTIAASLLQRPLTKPLYRAVFTAHPVFALQKDASDALCKAASSKNEDRQAQTAKAYEPRTSVTLQEEHSEAMQALVHARKTIHKINDALLRIRAEKKGDSWRNDLPIMIGVSTWVGYDLDGRSDIGWLDTLVLRIREKHQALSLYCEALSSYDEAGLAALKAKLEAERISCQKTLASFDKLADTDDNFASIFNDFTDRDDKLISSAAMAGDLHDIAKSIANDEIARALMVIAADIATHGFGMGEIHLRINAVQLRNAMRSIDGRSLSTSEDSLTSRILMERLASRIETETPWQINFSTLDQEATTARRQLMLAAQFIKHIDADQPLRLLIAECERPITFMSALYLSHKLGLSDKIDISPLFETSFGLENGANMMAQLFDYKVVQSYIRGRGRIAIQLGFSDAGRFMGQLAANLAIERLQIKIIDLTASIFGTDIELLIFNTHGESLGRGCARPTLADRQEFILTPFVRAHAQKLGVRLYHQSSFQGGDGYRLFGNQTLSDASLLHVIDTEIKQPTSDWQSDPFYSQHDFALDLFLALKQWHEQLFSSPDYGLSLDVFGANLLPKTGSRPAKRVVQAGNERRDPSKMRAIPHNALLQQLGFLAIVVSGIGSAAHIDSERFAEIFAQSPRLQQMIAHVDEAKRLGSLNVMLAYARLTDNGFWIGRAYHGNQHSNQRAFRQLASHLNKAPYAAAMRQTAWKLRDDLIYLYRLFNKLDRGNIRTTGTDRLTLDLLHALRLTIITDSLLKIAKVPRFAESNRHSNTDLVNAGLRLDFETACQIIEIEFPEKHGHHTAELAEADSYLKTQSTGYEKTREQLLAPLYDNQKKLRLITQLISAHYGAHG